MVYRFCSTLIFVLLLLSSFLLQAQQTEDHPGISTDRPGFGESSSVLPHQRFQMESGVIYSWNSIGNIQSEVFTFPSTIIRYGLLEQLELRLRFSTDKVNSQVGGVSARSPVRVAPWVIGFKTQISRQQGAWPEVALEGNLSIPLAVAQPYQNLQPAPYFYLPVSWVFSDQWNLNCNYAMFWDGATALPTYQVVLTPGFVLNDRINAFAELYFFVDEIDGWRWGTDAGIAWAILPQLQLDLSAGLGLNEAEADGFVNFGLSFCLW